MILAVPYLLAHGASFDVSFGNECYYDELLLERFLELNGVDFSVKLGQQTVVQMHCEKLRAGHILSMFSLSYGPEFAKGWPATVVRDPWPVAGLTSETLLGKVRSGAGADSPWMAFSKTSLLYRAYRDLVDRHKITDQDVFVRCDYFIRPWLTRGLRRTDAVIGTLDVRRGTVARTVGIVYAPTDPGDPMQ